MFLRIELRSKNSINSTIRNRLLLQVIHFRNAFEAVALQSSQRLPELLFYTKKSYRILQATAPIPAPTTTPILQGYPYTIHPPCSIHIYTCTSREFSIQKSNSTYRRQSSSSTTLQEILCIEGKEIF